MSKLYEKYLVLKKADAEKLYLFKSGIFYIFLDDDAKKVSPLLNLKLGNLNDSVVKCGFPVNSLSVYLKKFELLGLNVCINDSVKSQPRASNEYLLNNDVRNFIIDLSTIDSNNLSIREAYLLIDNIQERAKNFIKEHNIEPKSNN